MTIDKDQKFAKRYMRNYDHLPKHFISEISSHLQPLFRTLSSTLYTEKKIEDKIENIENKINKNHTVDERNIIKQYQIYNDDKRESEIFGSILRSTFIALNSVFERYTKKLIHIGYVLNSDVRKNYMLEYTKYDQSEQRRNSDSKRQPNSLSNREVQFLGDFPKETEFRLNQLEDILQGRNRIKFLSRLFNIMELLEANKKSVLGNDNLLFILCESIERRNLLIHEGEEINTTYINQIKKIEKDFRLTKNSLNQLQSLFISSAILPDYSKDEFNIPDRKKRFRAIHDYYTHPKSHQSYLGTHVSFTPKYLNNIISSYITFFSVIYFKIAENNNELTNHLSKHDDFIFDLLQQATKIEIFNNKTTTLEFYKLVLEIFDVKNLRFKPGNKSNFIFERN